MLFLVITPDGNEAWVTEGATQVAKALHEGSLDRYYEIAGRGQDDQLTLSLVTLDSATYRMRRENLRELRANGQIIATLIT